MDDAMSTAAPPYRIGAPVLALAGASDHVNPTSTVRRIAKPLPNDQVRFPEKSEHEPWLDGRDDGRSRRATLACCRRGGVKPTAARPARKKAAKLMPFSATPAGAERP